VTKRFNGLLAVDDLDLSVPCESLYGFIGPNGSGKPTTLRMIMHILLPDSGEIEVLGERGTRVAHDRLSYLSEERGLCKRVTVRRLLQIPERAAGLKRLSADMRRCATCPCTRSPPTFFSFFLFRVLRVIRGQYLRSLSAQESAMRQPVLIFDFGNVVGFFDYLRACERFAGHVGMTGLAFRDLVIERGFPRLHAEFESGRIEPEAFAARLMEISGVRIPFPDFVRAWEDIFWLNDSVARLIAFLKTRGYLLYLGSNTNLLHAAFYRRQFAETLDLFDGFILSYEVGHMKPAREFFDACVKAAGVPALSCLFIDDIAENIEGAREAGLTAVRYVDAPTLMIDLARAGVEVPGSEG
jgi:FMN phosphatase YigB (HAD superfamily)